MRLRCNRCGSINIKTDPGDGTARCIHCHSEDISVLFERSCDISQVEIDLKKDEHYECR